MHKLNSNKLDLNMAQYQLSYNMDASKMLHRMDFLDSYLPSKYYIAHIDIHIQEPTYIDQSLPRISYIDDYFRPQHQLLIRLLLSIYGYNSPKVPPPQQMTITLPTKLQNILIFLISYFYFLS